MWLRLILMAVFAIGSLSFPVRLPKMPFLSPRPANTPVLDTSSTDRQLRQRIQAIAKAGVQAGVAVVSLKTDSLVFAFNATSPMTPASNQKLLVTAACWAGWDDSLVAGLRSKLGRPRGTKNHHSPPRHQGTKNQEPRTKNQEVKGQEAKGRGVESGDSLAGFPERDSLTGLAGYDLLCRIHKWSDNSVANRLLTVQVERSGRAAQDVVRRYLDSAGVWAGGLNVVDGSGRSPRNRVAPLTIAQVLITMPHAPKGSAYVRSLARAGLDGTLRRQSLGLEGKVLAKTGSIGGTYALSGYLPGNQDTLAFAILLNQCYDKAAAFRFFGELLQGLSGTKATLPRRQHRSSPPRPHRIEHQGTTGLNTKAPRHQGNSFVSLCLCVWFRLCLCV